MRRVSVPPVKIQYTDVALAPTYATDGSAGFDIRSARHMEIRPGHVVRVPTGLYMAVPKDYCCLLYSRSGLALNAGVRLVNGVGVIDSDYRGEIYLSLENRSVNTFQIKRGDRLAQGIIQPAPQVKFVPVQSLPETERGDGGFGSTGS